MLFLFSFLPKWFISILFQSKCLEPHNQDKNKRLWCILPLSVQILVTYKYANQKNLQKVNTVGRGLEWKKADSLRVSQMKSLHSDSDTVILTALLCPWTLPVCTVWTVCVCTDHFYWRNSLHHPVFIFTVISAFWERKRAKDRERERENIAGL